MRRFTLLVAGALCVVACSSNGSKTSTSLSSSSSASTTTSTLPPDVQSAADHDGAIAFATLVAATLRRDDPSITQEQVDCLPPTLVDGLGAHTLLELSDVKFAEWPQANRDSAIAAFRGCGFSDDLLRRLGLLA